MWTKGCRHSWHYIFKWKGRRYRAALDDELRRHVNGKTEALKEVEKIYDAVREGTFGRESAETLALRQLGDRYFKKHISPKTGRSLGRNERYRWNVMIEAKVHGRLLGDYMVSDLKKHHVEAFVDANRVERDRHDRGCEGQHLPGEARRRCLDEPLSGLAQGVLQLGH
jgi:hypothetical protein